VCILVLRIILVSTGDVGPKKNVISLYYIYRYRVFTKNGTFSKINKKFISRLTQAKRTLSAAATVQVVYALIIILHCVHPG
jgi:hypothetical protein